MDVAWKFHREHILPAIPPKDPRATAENQWAALITSPKKENEMSLFDRLTSAAPTPAPAAVTAAALDAKLNPPEPAEEFAQVIPPDAAPLSAALLPPTIEQNQQSVLADLVGVTEENAVKRKRRTKAEMAEATRVAASVASIEASNPAPSGQRTSINLPFTPEQVRNGTSSRGFTLYVDCVPNSPGVESLAGYVAKISEKIAKQFAVEDIRCAPNKFEHEGKVIDHPLAFGKWKGIVAACVRAEPPKPAAYTVLGSDEVLKEVVNTLEPMCGPGLFIRGVRA